MISLVLRDPPPWLDPAVPTETKGVKRHRLYKPGDCWYATSFSDHPGAWFMFADGPSEPFTAWDENGNEIQRTVDHRCPLAIAREHDGKRPMIVVLPNGRIFCLHQPTSSSTSGWQVRGQLPSVTVIPSIDDRSPGGWHGHIQNGVLK